MMHTLSASIDMHCIKSWDAKSFSKNLYANNKFPVHISLQQPAFSGGLRFKNDVCYCNIIIVTMRLNKQLTKSHKEIGSYNWVRKRGAKEKQVHLHATSKFGFTDLKVRQAYLKNRTEQHSYFIANLLHYRWNSSRCEYSMYHTRHHESVLWWRWNCAFKRHVIHLTLWQRWSINNADMVLWNCGWSYQVNCRF